MQNCYASTGENNLLQTLLSLLTICCSQRTLSSSQTLNYEKHKQLIHLLLGQQSCRQ